MISINQNQRIRDNSALYASTRSMAGERGGSSERTRRRKQAHDVFSMQARDASGRAHTALADQRGGSSQRTGGADKHSSSRRARGASGLARTSARAADKHSSDGRVRGASGLARTSARCAGGRASGASGQAWVLVDAHNGVAAGS